MWTWLYSGLDLAHLTYTKFQAAQQAYLILTKAQPRWNQGKCHRRSQIIQDTVESSSLSEKLIAKPTY